jgi:hypothetical protein
MSISFICSSPALEHAAINNKPEIAAFHQIAGTSYFTRGAMKSEFHKPIIGFTAELAFAKWRCHDTVRA